MKLKDILELEKWEYMHEVTALFSLCEALSIDPDTRYQIFQNKLPSKDVAECLQRDWLFDIEMDPNKKRTYPYDFFTFSWNPSFEPTKETFFELYQRFLSWEKNIRLYTALDHNFKEPFVKFSYDPHSYKGIPFLVVNSLEFLHHLIFFGPPPPVILREYLGVENIIYLKGNFKDRLNVKIQTIGHVLFSTKNTELRWNQKWAATSPIFEPLVKEYEDRRVGADNRSIRDALKDIIPQNCRKRGNPVFTTFSEKEINQAPLPLSHIILPSHRGCKINFELINIVVNCAIVTRAIQLSADRFSLCQKTILALPVLAQIQECLNQQEKEILRYGITRLLKK